MGTLQALLTELSGLKKPRGFVNRCVRRALGMRPKPPPKYRILVMMATNMPEALDQALLRPGRIDRIYKVGYPSKAGRVRTYEGYLDKVQHELTAEQIDKLATITPYATGATIKDLVNEALINAIRDGREIITWTDVMQGQAAQGARPARGRRVHRARAARRRRARGLPRRRWPTGTRRPPRDRHRDDREGQRLPRAWSRRIPPEDQFTRWRTEYETDIMVCLASLAGERMFFGGDNSSGVSGDLDSATMLTGSDGGALGHGHRRQRRCPRCRSSASSGGTPEDGAAARRRWRHRVRRDARHAQGGAGRRRPRPADRDEPGEAAGTAAEHAHRAPAARCLPWRTPWRRTRP